MLKIREQKHFDIVFFVERLFQPVASCESISTPTYGVEYSFYTYGDKYGDDAVE